jgi:hypothetical protein
MPQERRWCGNSFHQFYKIYDEKNLSATVLQQKGFFTDAHIDTTNSDVDQGSGVMP